MLDIKMKCGTNYSMEGFDKTYLSRTSKNIKDIMVWFDEDHLDDCSYIPQFMVATVDVDGLENKYSAKKKLTFICINYYKQESRYNVTHDEREFYPVQDNLIRVFADEKFVYQYSLGGDFHLAKERFMKEVKGELSYLVTDIK